MFLRNCPPCLRQGLSLGPGGHWLGCMASEPWGFTHRFSSAGIINTHNHVQFFTWMLGISLRSPSPSHTELSHKEPVTCRFLAVKQFYLSDLEHVSNLPHHSGKCALFLDTLGRIFFSFFLFCVCCFEKGFHTARAHLEFTMQRRMSWTSDPPASTSQVGL